MFKTITKTIMYLFILTIISICILSKCVTNNTLENNTYHNTHSTDIIINVVPDDNNNGISYEEYLKIFS